MPLVNNVHARKCEEMHTVTLPLKCIINYGSKHQGNVRQQKTGDDTLCQRREVLVSSFRSESTMQKVALFPSEHHEFSECCSILVNTQVQIYCNRGGTFQSNINPFIGNVHEPTFHQY